MTGTDIVRQHLLTGGVDRVVDRVEIHQVTLPPGQAAGLHTHPGGVAGHVVSGRISYERAGHPTQELHAGSAFFEPAGATVRRFDNASDSEPAVFIACYLLTGDQPLIHMLGQET